MRHFIAFLQVVEGNPLLLGILTLAGIACMLPFSPLVQ